MFFSLLESSTDYIHKIKGSVKVIAFDINIILTEDGDHDDHLGPALSVLRPAGVAARLVWPRPGQGEPRPRPHLLARPLPGQGGEGIPGRRFAHLQQMFGDRSIRINYFSMASD